MWRYTVLKVGRRIQWTPCICHSASTVILFYLRTPYPSCEYITVNSTSLVDVPHVEVRYIAQKNISGFISSWSGLKHIYGGSDGKESACRVGDPGLIPVLGRSPWRREWLSTPVFLPGEFHRQQKPGWLQSTGSQRLGHDWATNTCFHFKHTCTQTYVMPSSHLMKLIRNPY